MTQSELKELTNLGAELGAAKAENERLRGLLQRVTNELEDLNSAWLEQADDCAEPDEERENCDATQELIDEVRAALSQQAEPTDTFTAVDMINQSAQAFRDGQAAVEQATAQDEREVAAVIGFYEGEREPRLLSWNVLPNGEHRLYTRPAQTEQQPVSWQFYQDGKWWNGGDRIKDHRKNTEAAGIPVRDLYAAPIAQTAPQSDCEWCAGAGKDHFGEKCEHCQTAPQPEQSGLVEMVDRAMVEMRNIHPPMRRSDCERLIRAALSAQGAGDASA